MNKEAANLYGSIYGLELVKKKKKNTLKVPKIYILFYWETNNQLK